MKIPPNSNYKPIFYGSSNMDNSRKKAKTITPKIKEKWSSMKSHDLP